MVCSTVTLTKLEEHFAQSLILWKQINLPGNLSIIIVVYLMIKVITIGVTRLVAAVLILSLIILIVILMDQAQSTPSTLWKNFMSEQNSLKVSMVNYSRTQSLF